MVVYHGTNWNPYSEKEGNAVFTSGWFTELEGRASRFGKPISCFLNIKNPIMEDDILPNEFNLNDPRTYGEHDGYISYIDYPGEAKLSQFAISKIKRENPNDFEKVIAEKLANMPTGRKMFSIIPKNPNQIKSATDNDGSFSEDNDDIRFSISNHSNDIFYSNAERAVEQIKQEKATPEQWRAMIEKAGGLKAGEDKWIGLSDWLKSQHAQVEPQENETKMQYVQRAAEANKRFTLTKPQILDFIRQNKIQIEETEYGAYDSQQVFEDYRREFKGYYDEAATAGEEDPQEVAWNRMLEEHGEDFSMGFYAYGDELLWDEDSDYIQWELQNSDSNNGMLPINDTRMQYTTEGLENKREIALTVPTIESWNEGDDIHFGDAGEGRAIAWVRFGDTTDNEGNKVLVIDEIQSKRHQEGRELGYTDIQSSELLHRMNKAEKEYSDYLESMRDKYGQMRLPELMAKMSDEELAEANRLDEAADKARQEWHAAPNQAVPSAPFEKNWHELAMKRILRFAAENGYDKVAWTTGAQQAQRYDLSEVIESIELEHVGNNGRKMFTLKGLDYKIITEPDGKIHAGQDEFIGKNLSDVVGKEVANKMLQMEEGDILEGDNLRIGGEGMRGFYDDMLPRFMQKYGKKWGAQVGEVTMPQLENGYQTMHSVDITDPMRESVLQGQPMFSISGKKPTNDPIKPLPNETKKDYVERIIRGQQAEIGKLDKVANFITNVLQNNTKQRSARIDLPEYINRKAEREIGHKIISHSINANEIRHTKNRHGEEGSALTEKSIPLRDKDIALMPYIMAAPTRLEKGTMATNGTESIRYTKELSNGIVVVVEREGRFDREEMENITMWAEKKPTTNVTVAQRASHSTSETIVISEADIAKIKQDAEKAIIKDLTSNAQSSVRKGTINSANTQADSEISEFSDSDVRFSIRKEEPPTKTGIGYKVFYRGKDGKLYPPMVANPNGADTPIGVWLDADAAPIAGESKTGRPQVKAGGKGTQGGSGQLAYRQGWHLGEIPYALQFNRKDAEGNKTLFPKDFVWAEVEYAADVDYQQEAEQEGITENGKYRHSYAGLKHLPTDGFYRYRTNPNPETDPWIITGAMKVNRVLTNEEVDDIVRRAGREPQQREDSDTRFSVSAQPIAFTPEEQEQVDRLRDLIDEKPPKKTDSETLGEYVHRVQEWRKNRAQSLDLVWSSLTDTQKALYSSAAYTDLAEQDRDTRNTLMRNLTKELQTIRSVSGVQRQYDQATTKRITDFVKLFIERGWAKGATDAELKRLLDLINKANGKQNIQAEIDAAVETLAEIHKRHSEDILKMASKQPKAKKNASGVRVASQLDAEHAEMLAAFNDFKDKSEEIIGRRIQELQDKLEESDDPIQQQQIAARIAGAELARRYSSKRQELEANVLEIEQQLGDLKAELRQAESEEQKAELKEKRRELNRLKRAALRSMSLDQKLQLAELNNSIAADLLGIKQAGRETYLENQKAKREHKNNILHFVASDLKGVPAAKNESTERKGKMVNNFLSPLRTFIHELRKYGVNAAGGEGYLYNHFSFKGYQARANYLIGVREIREMLDNKAAELFGKGQTWQSVMKNESNKPSDYEMEWLQPDEVEVDSAGIPKKKKPRKQKARATYGQLMYVYMVHKMTDGRMKLLKMNITDEDVAAMKDALPEQLVELADWLQDEFFPTTRKKYNATNIRVFGEPMAEIEHYVPLKIAGESISKSTDVGDDDIETLPSNIVGSVISRVVNTKPIDIRNTDAMDLVWQKSLEMEHWAAYAEFIEDINTLLSSSKFKNKINKMNPWNYSNFKKVAKLAVDAYNPQTSAADEIVTGLIRMAAVSKISFHLQTAIKQTLSFISPLSEADPNFHKHYAKALAHPIDNLKWALDTLPMFRERWESRQHGDEKLNIGNIETNNKQWDAIFDWAQQYLVRSGMPPNAFVDAITCANMARAQYEAKLEHYKSRGYSQAVAEERAKWKADEIYNETQQSTEGMYISAMQRTKTFIASVFSLFNNSSMAYERKNAEAMREIYKIAKRDREDFVAFREKQLIRDGVAEDNAREYAEQDYKRARTHAIADIAINGYLIQLLWNMGGKAFKWGLFLLPMLMFGGDDDRKRAWKEMQKDMKEAGVVSAVQPVRGLPFGATAERAMNIIYQNTTEGSRYRSGKEWMGEIAGQIHPIFQDLANPLSEMSKKETDKLAVASQLVNLAVASGTSIDPKTLANMLGGLEDLVEKNKDLTWNDIAEDLGLILNAPPSQIRYIVMQPRSGETREEYVRRYMEYQKLQKYGIFTPFVETQEPTSSQRRTLNKAWQEQRED